VSVAAGPELDDRESSNDAWLDEALAQSFPASDPLPFFHRDAPAPDEANEPNGRATST
jgi:hypothetical protein